VNKGERARKTYDAEASKKAILDAAEALFAEKGFEATSLQEIASQAGLSRGTPNYFFGSKEQLYTAVLERTMARSQDLLTLLREQIQRPGASAKESMSVVIGRLFDDFVAHPSFIRITEWEALQGARHLGNLPSQLQVLREAVKILHEELDWQGDAEQFLIDMVALCWFPMAHGQTFLKALDIDAQDPDFLAKYKQHIITLLLERGNNGSKED